MPSITVKNIPDEVYSRLRAAAETNRRSINMEIIARIEESLISKRLPARNVIARIRQLHARLGDRKFSLEQLEEARREGRP
jgi:plasmid stability protein